MTAVDDLLATVTGDTPAASDDPAVVGPVIRAGRYSHTHPETGEVVRSTRATNFAKLLADTYRIQQWEKRMVLVGAAMRPDITARAIAAGTEDAETLNKLAAEAKEVAGGNRGANLGSAMHDLTDRLDRGEQLSAPAPLDADLAAYRRALDHHGVGIHRNLIERHVCLPDLEVAGKFDRIVDWDGRAVIADLKTAAHVSYGWLEIAVQLALYAHAPWMWEPGVGWIPKPDVDLDEALVFHLPAGQADCRLYVVDIAAGWEAVQQADEVRRWRRRSKQLARALDTASSDDLEQLLDSQPAPAAETAAPPDGAGLVEQVQARTRAREASPWAGALDGGGDEILGELARSAAGTGLVVHPDVLADVNAQLRVRLGKVLQLLGDRLPAGAAWPSAVRKFPDGGPVDWSDVKRVERFVLDLEQAAEAPFAAPLPDLPPAPGAPEPATPVSKPIPDRVRLAHTPPDRLARLKARFEAIGPEDIRREATRAARAAGCADVEHLDDRQVELLDGILTLAEATHTARREELAARFRGWDATEVACITAAATGGQRDVEALEAGDVELVDLLLVALDSGVLAFAVAADGTVTFNVPTAVEARLTLRAGGRGALRDAARKVADRHGRPRPRSAAEAVADPVLVAVLASTHPTARPGGDEDTPTTTGKEQGAT